MQENQNKDNFKTKNKYFFARKELILLILYILVTIDIPFKEDCNYLNIFTLHGEAFFFVCLFITGHFAMSDDGSGSTTSKFAVIKSPGLSQTSAQCMLEFSYYANNAGYQTLQVSHQQEVNKKTVESYLFKRSLLSRNYWRKITMGIGQRPDGKYLSNLLLLFCLVYKSFRYAKISFS